MAPRLSAAALLGATRAVSAERDPQAVLARTLESAELLGARAGFIVLNGPNGPRIAHYRGLDADRLRTAAATPGFHALITGAHAIVERSSHAVVGALVPRYGQVLASFPLSGPAIDGGRLCLVFDIAPEGDGLAFIGVYAEHVGLALSSATLVRDVGHRRDQLASVVHSMANPVVVVDGAGNFLVVNAAAGELFHIAGVFEEGKPAMGRLGPMVEALLDRNEDGEVEVPLGSPPRLYRVSSRRVRAARGEVLGRVLVFDDVTALREADALKTDFVAVVGHELRTPLTVVRGYAQLLQGKWRTLPDERIDQAVDSIESASHRLEHLIDGVLFVAAIDNKQPTLDLRPTDVGDLLDRFGSERVTVQRPHHAIDRVIDAAMVEAVLHNLVENACKYSIGEITVELQEHGDSIELGVVDRGEGIFSGDIPLLFERFSQGDGSSTRRHGGMGIGLYLSRRMVEAMGGRIWCESRLGVGSRFAFSIPAPQRAAAGPAVSAPATPATIDA